MSDQWLLYHEACKCLTAEKRGNAELLHAQAVAYVWGFQDAGGEDHDTARSSLFGNAYGLVAARFEAEEIHFRPPITDAWRSWQEYDEIRAWLFGQTQRLDGPFLPVRNERPVPDTMGADALNQRMKDELAERRAAAPEVDWTGVDEWIERSYSLIRPGGVVSLVLPDGKPFTGRKESNGG